MMTLRRGPAELTGPSGWCTMRRPPPLVTTGRRVRRRPTAMSSPGDPMTVGDDSRGEAAIRVEQRSRSYRPRGSIVAFSGGVDSSVVLALAVRALGRAAVRAVTALSPSYPDGELELARAATRRLGVCHETVTPHEVEKASYAQTDPLRCLYCKLELYSFLRKLAPLAGSGEVMLAGANLEDTADFRPGLLADRRYCVRHPLLEERIGKAAVPAMARQLGVAGAKKPALACLSSRVAYGGRITPEILHRIDRAEQLVRARGFPSVRVRHFGTTATIEIPRQDTRRLAADPELPDLLAALERLGWRQVSVDQNGLRSGGMNAAIRITPTLRRSMERLKVDSAQPPR